MTRSHAGKSDPCVFISAAEPSGDLHAASLIRAVRRERTGARFVGLAGPSMQQAGCEAIRDLTRDSVMLLGIVSRIYSGWRLLAEVERFLAARRPDAVVLVDSPVLHLPLAARARSLGIPVFYYIAPQVWAWAEYRVRKIRRRVDRLAVILPFEEAYFRRHGIPARYVGHPLFDSPAVRDPVPDRVAQLRSRGRPVLAILPGSRTHVIREVLPGQLEVAAAVAERHPELAVNISAASDEARAAIDPIVNRVNLPAMRIDEHTPDVIAAADVVLVASGTATLVVARYAKPMIVMYNASRWGYVLIGRHVIRTPHLSLVNILAGRELVPEFMPYYPSTEPIARAALELFDSAPRREAMTRDLEALMAPIAQPGASANAARELLDLIDGGSF